MARTRNLNGVWLTKSQFVADDGLACAHQLLATEGSVGMTKPSNLQHSFWAPRMNYRTLNDSQESDKHGWKDIVFSIIAVSEPSYLQAAPSLLSISSVSSAIEC